MSIKARVALLYGKDYLWYAIRSVIKQVDSVVVAYTYEPNEVYYKVDEPSPDNRDELYKIARNAAGKKLDWREDVKVEVDADILLTLDADEVWDRQQLKDALREVDALPFEEYRVRPITLWRSFNLYVEDVLAPVRFLKKGGVGEHYLPQRFYHFGAARSLPDMKYKLLVSVHGQGNDLMHWFHKKFKPWPPIGDIHPERNGWWTPMPFDKNELPAIMRRHPYWDKEPIT